MIINIKYKVCKMRSYNNNKNKHRIFATRPCIYINDF